MVLNSPCNPSGTTYTESELREIADIVLEKGIYVISDEIYEKIVYDGFQSVSIASLDNEIKERTIIAHGVSKDVLNNRLADRIRCRAEFHYRGHE